MIRTKLNQEGELAFPKQLILHFVSAVTKKPIQGIVCRITFFAKQKNNYVVQPSPTNENGITVITKEEVENEFQNIRSFWLMDFDSALDECFHKVQLEVPSAMEIAEGINNYLSDKQFRKLYKAQYKRELDVDSLRSNKNGDYMPTRIFIDLGGDMILEEKQVTIALKPTALKAQSGQGNCL